MKRLIVLILLLCCSTAYAELWGTGSASTLIVQDAGDEDATYYLGLWRAVAGALIGKTDTGITYNPNSNALTLSGDFTIGSVAFDVDSTNNTVGIGGAAVANVLLRSGPTITNVTASQFGIRFLPTYAVGAAALDFTSFAFAQSIMPKGNNVGDVIGAKLFLDIFEDTDATVTIDNVIALYSEMIFRTTGRNSIISVAEARYINLHDPVLPGTSDITTLIAFFAEEMTVGDTNWQAYSVGGAWFIGGTDGIYFGQEDGEERIVSSTATTLDLYATDSIELHDATNIGDGTNEMKVDGDGDTYWAGTAGLIFGSFFGNDINFVVAGGTGTYSIITDADIAVGQTNNTTFQNNQELDIGTFVGMYEIKYSCTVKGTGAGKHLVAAIGVDVGGVTGDVAQGPGRSHSITLGNSEMTLCSTAILDLSADDEVSIMITNETDNSNVTIDHVNLVLTQIGGT